MQQRLYFLLILHRNFLPKNPEERFNGERERLVYTCSSHRVIDMLVSSSIIVISRRFESRFDVRLTNGITAEHVSTIPITSLVHFQQKKNTSSKNLIYQ